MKLIFNLVFAMIFLVTISGFASASLVLDNIYYDPAIISAGDEVDIVVQFHEEGMPTGETRERIADSDYSFHVRLEADDRMTEEYITIQDESGDNMNGGSVYVGEKYNKKFRVKVNNDAPAGSYEFKLSGRWYNNGEPEGVYQYVRFKMDVKKEGINLDVANIETEPAEVRPGDDYVKLTTYLENVGQKDSKSVEVRLDTGDGIEPSYTNNNRVWAGRLNSGESKMATFYVDIDDDVKPGAHNISYHFNYMDVDDNHYQKERVVPFRLKSRPYLEVVKTEGEGLAGNKGTLEVTVKNTGQEDAEAVDVRILKQNSQPFTFDVRSDYIGELSPGETGLAVFEFDVLRDAEEKVHNFKLLIRSKGDSDEGDNDVYTYSRKASYLVTGQAGNPLKMYGGAAALIVVMMLVGNTIYKRTNKVSKK